MTMDSRLRGNDGFGLFARYPSYKDSGVEWLGEVPSEWRIAKIKSICSHLRDGTHGSFKRVDDGYLLLSVRNIVNSEFVLLPDDSCISEQDYKSISKSLKIKEGDLQLAIVGATLGKVALVPDNMPKFVTQRSLATLRPVAKILCNRFLFFFAGNSYFQDSLWSKTNYSAQPGVYLYTISNIDILLPSIFEQTAIANYLDTKTAQIDRKIELLSQKAEKYGKLKQSLINETVTRGLDQSVPMKDSGIEWIGDVPAHWEVKHLKSLAKIKGGKDSKAVEIEVEGYPIYGSGGVFGRASEYLHKKTSVLLGRKGTIDKPLFVTEPFWSVDTMFYTDIKKNVDPKFFYYQCLTIKFGLYQYGSAVPSMAENVLSRLLFATPKYEEQQKISSYLDEKATQIDQIIETVNSQVNNLKELRKTLINDVVTGKVKVVGNG